ncbi:hypothetical protein C0991_000074 [Blastosporella zonata]|nr:hypothetical protein C0991_000074 [Blastosporella zonata]
MAPLPSRKSLEAMKRVDLQRLCKDYGVKANLKSEALIDLLIDTAFVYLEISYKKPPVPSTPTARSVSTRHSSRGGPSRISSIIIHDTEGEGEETDAQNIFGSSESDAPGPSLQHECTPPLATRTRKGKEQTRLGVGRPAVAGGSGPRAVTRSLSITKGKRGKGSRSLKPTEAAIPEEEVEQDGRDLIHETLPDSVPSQETSQSSQEQHPPEAALESLATIDRHVADALRPLHEQIKSMKSELELMQSLKTEVRELKAQLNEMGSLKKEVESLTATVRDLRKEANEAAALRVDYDADKDITATQVIATPSTPKAQSPANRKPSGVGDFSLHPPSLDAHVQGSNAVATTTLTLRSRPLPGIATSTLGKRHRDSTATEVAINTQEANLIVNSLVQDEMGPSRKRAKLLDNAESVYLDSPQDGIEEESQEGSGTNYAIRGSGFRVFSDLEGSPMELADPPPPTESLPDFFTPASPLESEVSIIPRQGYPVTSTANAAENQQPFTFSFQHAISSTPAHGMFMPSFPYPEPPQSPSPAGSNLTGFLNLHQPGRADVFQALGLPQPGRPSRATGLRSTSGLTGGFVDPSALTRNSYISGDPSARALEASTSASTSVGTTEPSQMKRTMYGTEMDGDTRFGDFGVEGVGNNSRGGFWAGGRF